MKKTITILITAILLSSCSIVYFENTVPKKGKELANFPKELVGMYINIKNNDTLTITKKTYQIGKVKNTNTIFENGDLSSGEFSLKKYKKSYILNIRKSIDEGYWLAIPIELENNILKVYYLMLEKDNLTDEELKAYKKKKIEEIKAITDVKAIIHDKDENYIINPSDAQFKKMKKNNLFDLIYEFKKISD